ncbi:hypothetical protein V757_11190 [Pelistega indica]|uniref:Uncharacterized protein n=1 Tax=Pelistega indica TaxID=1414851 RepID=V8FUK0_9BURK|nr:hypothetical protein [Pelistega indica]ETD67546.1 hypothetical protein V757_11190 [Pelistega indica]
MAQANQVPFTPVNPPRPAPHPAAAYVPADDAQTSVVRENQVFPAQTVQPNVPQPVHQPVHQPVAQQGQPVQPAPAYQPQPVAQPQWNIADWQRQQYQLMEEQRAAYTQQLTAKEQELALANARLAEYEAKQTQDEDFSTFELGEMEYVDDTAAKEIRDKILAPMLKQINKSTNERLNKINSSFQTTINQINEEQYRTRLADTNKAITDRHPDIDVLARDPAYVAFMQETIPGTLVTRGSQVEAAYKAGNATYVNQVLDQFKGGQPTLAQVAAPPISTVSAPLTPDNYTRFTYADLEEQKQRFNRREISHETYRTFLDEFNAAEREGRVG